MTKASSQINLISTRDSTSMTAFIPISYTTSLHMKQSAKRLSRYSDKFLVHLSSKSDRRYAQKEDKSALQLTSVMFDQSMNATQLPASAKQGKKVHKKKHTLKSHERILYTEEQSKWIRQYLTVDIIQQALHGLHNDRIRPLLVDVYQRVKQIIQKYLDESTSDMEVGESPCPLPKQKCQFDVYLLFIYIQSTCLDVLSINTSDVNIPSHLSNAFAYIRTFNIHASHIVSIPELIPYLNQVMIEFRTPNFTYLPWINPHDPYNPYNDAVWHSLGSFIIDRLLATTTTSNSSLMPYHFKGGRYGLALELKNTDYPALQQLTLGELCHVIQLAIQHHILAYEQSILQPIASCTDRSRTFLKQECISRSIEENLDNLDCSSCSSTTASYESADVYDTLEEFAHDLNLLLLTKPDGLITAQLKKILQQRFHKTISPQRFGYKKLTDLLINDTLISPLCQVVNLHLTTSDCLLLRHRNYTECQSGSHRIQYSVSQTLETSCIPEMIFLPKPSSFTISYHAWELMGTFNRSYYHLRQKSYSHDTNDDDDDIDQIINSIHIHRTSESYTDTSISVAS